MAHKGKIYPIAQLWRIYNISANDTSSLIPEHVIFKAQQFVTPTSFVSSFVPYTCERLPWSPGDAQIGFQSDPDTILGLSVQVGCTGRLESPKRFNWKLCVWVSGVDQIPWGWHDELSHYPWTTGSLGIFFDPGPAGASIWPHGLMEVRGKRWDEL